MTANSSVKQLLKILIGAAWIDGKVQPEERQYLQKVAQDNGIAQDPEIYPLLNELVAVKASECYDWVREYLGDSPASEDYDRLLEAISGLIYSDGEVEPEEAKLLTRLQLADPAASSQQSSHNSLLNAIQKLYRKWIEQQS